MSVLSLYEDNIFNQGSRNFNGVLDIDRIKANPIYRCTISRKIDGAALTSRTITGVYNADSPFSIGINANYEDQFELPFQSFFDQLMAGGNWARNMTGHSQFILKSLRMTEQRWTGSEAPTFSIRMDIPIIRRNDAPWEVVKYCIRATSGTLQEYSDNGQVQRIESAFQIFAPNGYRIQYATTATSSDVPYGVYRISLGVGSCCWFDMQDAIITGMNATLGSKKYYDGNPTTVSVDVNFKYWRYPTYEDVIKWFPKMSNIP